MRCRPPYISCSGAERDMVATMPQRNRYLQTELYFPIKHLCLERGSSVEGGSELGRGIDTLHTAVNECREEMRGLERGRSDVPNEPCEHLVSITNID
jgi:hypothetical protein